MTSTLPEQGTLTHGPFEKGVDHTKHVAQCDEADIVAQMFDQRARVSLGELLDGQAADHQTARIGSRRMMGLASSGWVR
jgi:hypothetical protein